MIDPAELRALFDRVVTLSMAERSVFLDSACRDNPPLRAEVDRLLAAHDRAASVLDTGGTEEASGPGDALSVPAAATLATGTRLGPYVITAALGAGGMGEVYKARDTRLDRSVAIKVLPPGTTSDPAVRHRFDREARAAAALAHPHICTLLDVGRQDEVDYLVMEYLDGETLAVRLTRKRLPLDQALTYGTQIAEALDAAHQAGIVHRDLKPGNVMLTRTGAKLLDFGLAKRRQAVVTGELTTLESHPITHAGMILGTLPYMAPEQLEGREADARTDIWALGAILYEMLAGRRAFESGTPVTLIGEILHATPPSLATREPLTPPALERLVHKCLAKDPGDRWDTAHDLADELRWIGHNLATPIGLAVSQQGRRKLLVPLMGGAVLVTALVGAGVSGLLRSSPPAPSLVRVTLDVRPAEELNAGGKSLNQMTPGGSRTALAWSADGRALVFVGRRGAVRQLYVRRLDEANARALAGTVGAQMPAVSPDGRWIAFWADGAIRKVPLEGGPVMEITPAVAAPPWGLVWTAAGTLLFGGRGEPIREVTAAGVLRAVTRLGEAETGHGLPSALPGGLSLLFTARKRERSWGDEAIVAYTLATGARRVLLRDAADARYLPTGHLVFMRRGVLIAVPFDAERLEIRGAEVPLLEPVAQALTSGDGVDFTGAGQFAVSGSGTLAWVPNPTVRFPESVLVAVDRRGKATALGAPVRSYAPVVRVSPDSRLLMVPVESLTERGLWVYDLDRRALTPLLRDGEVTWPLWSPDGQRAVFEWLKDGRFSIAALSADGTAAPRVLLPRLQPDVDWHARMIPSSITPDGQRLAAVVAEAGREDLVIAMLDDPKVRPVRWFETPESEGWPEFSPDGRWVAYASNAPGEYEVYVRPYPGRGPAYQVSVGGGSNPAWDPSGHALFFVSPPRAAGKQRMMMAGVESGSPLRLSAPRQLFEFESTDFGFDCVPARCFDVAPDGQRFYVTQSVRGPAVPAVTQVNLVLNWFEELRAKVPMQ
jgi:eukaryotic-like serine/threonine-protein kinase